jgi:hypothetical protein
MRLCCRGYQGVERRAQVSTFIDTKVGEFDDASQIVPQRGCAHGVRARCEWRRCVASALRAW